MKPSAVISTKMRRVLRPWELDRLITVDSLKTAALQEANAYCGADRKKLKVMHSKEIPAGP
jgi:hypothetical protein